MWLGIERTVVGLGAEKLKWNCCVCVYSHRGRNKTASVCKMLLLKCEILVKDEQIIVYTLLSCFRTKKKVPLPIILIMSIYKERIQNTAHNALQTCQNVKKETIYSGKSLVYCVPSCSCFILNCTFVETQSRWVTENKSGCSYSFCMLFCSRLY